MCIKSNVYNYTYIYNYYGILLAFRLGLLAATASPVQQHNPRLHSSPPTAYGIQRRKFGYGREGGAVRPYIYAYVHMYINES